MAKTSSIEKNNHRRAMVKQYQSSRNNLKKIIMDKSVGEEDRFNATLKLAQLPRNSSFTRVRNRCELTGRSRAYYRKFKLSRIALRDLALKGEIPGVVKASW